ncbi:MAG: trypsin-like serine protease [Burkholderiaceae bacterium]|nr:trypsin-like serine protease [Burkholderiaceae bacterium]
MTRTAIRALVAALAFPAVASASLIQTLTADGNATVERFIQAGAPPDSPANRIDPNLPTSPFTGVVSINIRYTPIGGPQQSFICSGTAISPFMVLTAAHCVDPLDNGRVIDITQPGNDVRVVVNDDAFFNPATDLITASQVTIHPNYQGFGICPDGTFGCLNDDLAIIRLSQALPDTVQIYRLYDQEVAPGTTFTMVGYGTSGDGLNGYTVPPSFFVKRVGANVYDLFDTDDEADFAAGSPREVWYYDFDGTRNGFFRDTFCLLGLACSPYLGNGVETHLGGGDSGGPSFIRSGAGEYLLVANNTFGINYCYSDDPRDARGRCRSGDFGDAGGGVLLYSYLSWIRSTAEIPEPGVLALLGIGALLLAGFGRRRGR